MDLDDQIRLMAAIIATGLPGLKYQHPPEAIAQEAVRIASAIHDEVRGSTWYINQSRIRPEE